MAFLMRIEIHRMYIKKFTQNRLRHYIYWDVKQLTIQKALIRKGLDFNTTKNYITYMII